MRLEPALCCALCCLWKESTEFTAGGSSALASPPQGGLPGRLALGCPRSLWPGPTSLQSRLPRARRRLASAVCGGSAGRGSVPLPGAQLTADSGKAGGGAGASLQGRLGPGDLPPSSGRLVAPHLLRSPPPPWPALNTQRAPSQTWGVAPGSLSLQSRG